jgi:hypothetical protein
LQSVEINTATTTGGKTVSGELQPDDTGNFATSAAIVLNQ